MPKAVSLWQSRETFVAVIGVKTASKPPLLQAEKLIVSEFFKSYLYFITIIVICCCFSIHANRNKASPWSVYLHFNFVIIRRYMKAVILPTMTEHETLSGSIPFCNS